MVATNAIAKVAAVVAGFALVASLFIAPVAKAATFTMDLTIGSTGAEVTALQSWLISKGYSIPAGATGYFGTQTQAAVAAYQAANGIAPAVGYFGPITRAHVNAAGGDMGGGSDDDDDFSSGDEEGYLDEFDQLGAYSSEEVGEDEEDVAVLGAELEAVDADQKIERVTVEIEISSESGSDDLEDYISDVSLWLDDEELGRMDVEDASFDRDGGDTGSDDEWSFRFTNLDGVVSEGDMADLVVAVTGVSNLDSGDATSWQVRMPVDGIRAVSPNGVDDTYHSSEFETTFTVESFASANDVELRFSSGDDNPDEAVVIVENEGDEIVLLQGEMKAEGSDIEVTDLKFNLSSANADIEDIIDELMLEIDGEEYSESISASAGTSEDVTFDDIDLMIDEDDTVTFTVTGISATSSVYAAQDITLKATTTVSSTEAEDASGEDLASGDLTGTANGEDQHLFTIVPMIEVVSTDIEANDNGDAAAESATATIVVDVTALGGTLYLNGDNSSTENLRFFVGQVYGSGVSASTTASSTTYSLSGDYEVSGSGGSSEYYTLNEDDTLRVTITSIVSQSTVTTTQVLAGLKALLFQYGTAATSEATRSSIDIDWTDLTDETQTGTVPLVNAS